MAKTKQTKAPKKAKVMESKEKSVSKSKVSFFKKIFNKKKDEESKGSMNSSLQAVIKIFILVVGIFAGVVVIDYTVQVINNDAVIAIVDNARISKSAWKKRVEKAYGASMASYMIDEKIIELEAKKGNVSVSAADIDAEIEDLKKQLGGEEQLKSALAANKATMEELKDQVKNSLLLNKLITPTLKYTEDDIKDYFNQYSSVLFPTESAALQEGEKLDYEKYKEETTKKYLSSMVSSNSTAWVAQKRSEYVIQNNATDKPKYGFLTATINAFNSLLKKGK